MTVWQGGSHLSKRPLVSWGLEKWWMPWGWGPRTDSGRGWRCCWKPLPVEQCTPWGHGLGFCWGFFDCFEGPSYVGSYWGRCGSFPIHTLVCGRNWVELCIEGVELVPEWCSGLYYVPGPPFVICDAVYSRPHVSWTPVCPCCPFCHPWWTCVGCNWLLCRLQGLLISRCRRWFLRQHTYVTHDRVCVFTDISNSCILKHLPVSCPKAVLQSHQSHCSICGWPWKPFSLFKFLFICEQQQDGAVIYFAKLQGGGGFYKSLWLGCSSSPMFVVGKAMRW